MYGTTHRRFVSANALHGVLVDKAVRAAVLQCGGVQAGFAGFQSRLVASWSPPAAV